MSIPTEAEERSMLQISFRTQGPNLRQLAQSGIRAKNNSLPRPICAPAMHQSEYIKQVKYIKQGGTSIEYIKQVKCMKQVEYVKKVELPLSHQARRAYQARRVVYLSPGKLLFLLY